MHEQTLYPTQFFAPQTLLSGAHRQTIWRTLMRSRLPRLDVRKEIIELPDGDFVNCFHVGPECPTAVVMVLHGLSGSIDSPYISALMHQLASAGMHGVLMEFRGSGGVPNRLPRWSHAGDFDDIAYVTSQMKTRFLDKPFYAVGYSLGGNVLLNWLGKTGSDSPLDKAIAVSVPYDLSGVTEHINHGFAKIYQYNILQSLKRNVRRKMQAMTLPFTAFALDQVKTIYAYDELITAPIHGFDSVAQYYSHACCVPHLQNITVPTQLIHALDDPFMKPEFMPRQESLPSCVEPYYTANGGHVGFIGSFAKSGNIPLESHILSVFHSH